MMDIPSNQNASLRGTSGIQESTYLLYNKHSLTEKNDKQGIENLKLQASNDFCFSKFLVIFNSLFDPSIVLYPYIFHRAGYVTCIGFLIFFSWLSYFTCELVFESTRLLIGNYKMRQKVDFESLLSSQMAQKSLAVSFSRTLYIILLIVLATTGIIFSCYTFDSSLVDIFGETVAL
mmetsp:Transcript_25460/g.24791  ORF Transcript_25460/g.24791 Transcript_25460/m.24791 type:complete len:176 (-) Transcript_25460:339-866(-)